MSKSKTQTAKANRMKTLLKANKHNTAKINALDMSTPKKLAEAVMWVHGLTLDDLRKALG